MRRYLLDTTQAIALGYTIVTDNEREFARIESIPPQEELAS